MEKVKRKSIWAKLKEYCSFSMGKDDESDFIEVTEWSNHEGFDVHISAGVERKHFQLTYGQFDALKKIIKELDK